MQPTAAAWTTHLDQQQRCVQLCVVMLTRTANPTYPAIQIAPTHRRLCSALVHIKQQA